MIDEHTGTVAVVNDAPAVLDSLRFLLAAAGHRVATYSSAVTFLANCGTPPACLIRDQQTPQMTGLEIAAELHAAGRPTHLADHCLIVAGVVARAAQLGIEKMLEQPQHEDDLLSFVNAHH